MEAIPSFILPCPLSTGLTFHSEAHFKHSSSDWKGKGLGAEGDLVTSGF